MYYISGANCTSLFYDNQQIYPICFFSSFHFDFSSIRNTLTDNRHNGQCKRFAMSYLFKFGTLVDRIAGFAFRCSGVLAPKYVGVYGAVQNWDVDIPKGGIFYSLDLYLTKDDVIGYIADNEFDISTHFLGLDVDYAYYYGGTVTCERGFIGIDGKFFTQTMLPYIGFECIHTEDLFTGVNIFQEDFLTRYGTTVESIRLWAPLGFEIPESNGVYSPLLKIADVDVHSPSQLNNNYYRSSAYAGPESVTFNSLSANGPSPNSDDHNGALYPTAETSYSMPIPSFSASGPAITNAPSNDLSATETDNLENAESPVNFQDTSDVTPGSPPTYWTSKSNIIDTIDYNSISIQYNDIGTQVSHVNPHTNGNVDKNEQLLSPSWSIAQLDKSYTRDSNITRKNSNPHDWISQPSNLDASPTDVSDVGTDNIQFSNPSILPPPVEDGTWPTTSPPAPEKQSASESKQQSSDSQALDQPASSLPPITFSLPSKPAATPLPPQVATPTPKSSDAIVLLPPPPEHSSQQVPPNPPTDSQPPPPILPSPIPSPPQPTSSSTNEESSPPSPTSSHPPQFPPPQSMLMPPPPNSAPIVLGPPPSPLSLNSPPPPPPQPVYNTPPPNLTPPAPSPPSPQIHSIPQPPKLTPPVPSLPPPPSPTSPTQSLPSSTPLPDKPPPPNLTPSAQSQPLFTPSPNKLPPPNLTPPAQSLPSPTLSTVSKVPQPSPPPTPTPLPTSMPSPPPPNILFPPPGLLAPKPPPPKDLSDRSSSGGWAQKLYVSNVHTNHADTKSKQKPHGLGWRQDLYLF